MKLVPIILVVFSFCSFGQDKAGDIHGWVSASTLWGQGNAGLNLKVFNEDIVLSDSFVFDWDKNEISYNETEVSISSKNHIYGVRGRWDKEYFEPSPFVGHILKIKTAFPVSFYNEIEYRDRLESDYFRSSHTLTVVYPYGFFGEKAIKPFVANSTFINVNSIEFEKNRIYFVYFLNLVKYNCMVYYIPKVYGDVGKEWDDTNKFGASVELKF